MIIGRYIMFLILVGSIIFALGNSLISITLYDYYAGIRQYCYAGNCSYYYNYIRPYYLYVDGSSTYLYSYSKKIVDNGRGVIYYKTVNKIYMENYIYVPSGNENWVRIITYLKNTDSTSHSVRIRFYNYFYTNKYYSEFDAVGQRYSTSDGDTSFERTDNWYYIDDKWDNNKYPARLLLLKDNSTIFSYTYSSGYTYTSGSYPYSYRRFYYEYSFTLNPGEEKSIIQFLVIGKDINELLERKNDILEAIRNGNISSEYFNDLIFFLNKRKYLENMVNFENNFPLPPKLQITKYVSNDTVYTWANVTVGLEISPEEIENRSYSFENIRIYDKFPEDFSFIGKIEEGVQKIAVKIEKYEGASKVFDDVLYFPIRLTEGWYEINIEPTNNELLSILRLEKNQTMKVYYTIIPKISGDYVLPSAKVLYYVNETVGP